MVKDGWAPFEATPEHRMVVIVGFGRREGARLVPRNRLYAEVASRHFLLSASEEAATGGKVAPPGAGSLNFVADADLRTIAEEMMEAGFAAFNEGHVRLGLIGLGSALEAILIDVLEQADEADLQAARKRARPKFNGQQNGAVPATWSLYNMIKVADELPSLAGVSVGAAHTVRELRNYVHPALVRESGLAQPDLHPEFSAAQGVLRIVIREAG